MLRVEPDVGWWLIALWMLCIVLGAVICAVVAGIDAWQLKRPFWSVIRSRLRGFIIGVAIFCTAVITLVATLNGFTWFFSR